MLRLSRTCAALAAVISLFAASGCVSAENANATGKRQIAYPDALDSAAISVPRLDDELEHALIIGNGDINALVYSKGGQIWMTLTKNDVWDARHLTEQNPPIPTLDLIKKRVRPSGPGGSHAFLPDGAEWGGVNGSGPYPCPVMCGKLALETYPVQPLWEQIRAQGDLNEWQFSNGKAVMRIEGFAEASNGYRFGPMEEATNEYSRLRIKLSGSANARYFISVLNAKGRDIYASGWTDTPAEPQEKMIQLPPDQTVGELLIYTWTTDGKLAENRFDEIVLEGPKGVLPIGVTKEAFDAPPTTSGRLDLRRAVVEIEEKTRVTPGLQIRALADRNVFLIHSGIGARLISPKLGEVPESVYGETDGVKWLSQELPGDVDWPGMQFTVAAATEGDLTAVAIVTSLEADDPQTAAINLARSTVASSTEELVRQHEAHWENFWTRSGIKIADAMFSDIWYRNIYFQGCVTKPGGISPGLFASLTTNRPAWHGDRHTNYNIQQAYWSTYVTNHPDLAEPYDRFIDEYLPRARWLCRQIFDSEGAYFPHMMFEYEPTHPDKAKSPGGRQFIDHTWGFTMGVPAFAVQPVWWHYKYEPSRELLEKIAYPAVRDVALFQVNFMDQCEGDEQVVLAPSVSPEHWGWTEDFRLNRNSTFDIAMFRYIFEAAIEGATTLQRDEHLVARWERALRRLPPYPTTSTAPSIVVDVQDAWPIEYNIAVPAVPVFPGNVVTWFSPEEEKELFVRTIESVRWNGNNSTIMLAVARARLSMPDSFDWLHAELSARLRSNGTLTLNRVGNDVNSHGHFTEQFAASMAISELLMQSVGDIIRVFPAWPKDKDASFSSLRAQGGFLVSAEHSDGQIRHVEIVSTVGGLLRLHSPRPGMTLLRNGKRPSPAPIPDERGVIEIDTRPGDVVTFE